MPRSGQATSSSVRAWDGRRVGISGRSNSNVSLELWGTGMRGQSKLVKLTEELVLATNDQDIRHSPMSFLVSSALSQRVPKDVATLGKYDDLSPSFALLHATVSFDDLIQVEDPAYLNL